MLLPLIGGVKKRFLMALIRHFFKLYIFAYTYMRV